MDLSTEMTRLSNIDAGAVKSTFSVSKEGLGAIASGLNSMGLMNDSSMRAVAVINGGLQIVTGMAGLATAAKVMQERKNTETEARSAALVAVNTALGPYGWAKIALAAGAMVATSAIMYATVNQIRLGSFDLETPSGRADATNAVMEVM